MPKTQTKKKSKDSKPETEATSISSEEVGELPVGILESPPTEIPVVVTETVEDSAVTKVDPLTLPRYEKVNPVDLFNFWCSWRKTINQGKHPLEKPYNLLPKEVRDKFKETAVDLFYWLDNFVV